MTGKIGTDAFKKTQNRLDQSAIDIELLVEGVVLNASLSAIAALQVRDGLGLQYPGQLPFRI